MDRTPVCLRGSRSSGGDYSESGFEAEPILPSQFFEGRNKNEALEPEKRLMLAVLTDAVHCYQIGLRCARDLSYSGIQGSRGVVIQPKGIWSVFIRECV